MFSYEGREAISALSDDNSIKELDYWVKRLVSLDKERKESGTICCDKINSSDICFECFSYHMDKKLIKRLKGILARKNKKGSP